MRSRNRGIRLVPLQVNRGCTKRGDAGISFTGKNAMGDLATTPELILGGTPSAKNSSRMMQAAGATPWSTMGPHSPDVSILNQPAQMQAAWQPTFATDLPGVKRQPTAHAR